MLFKQFCMEGGKSLPVHFTHLVKHWVREVRFSLKLLCKIQIPRNKKKKKKKKCSHLVENRRQGRLSASWFEVNIILVWSLKS